MAKIEKQDIKDLTTQELREKVQEEKMKYTKAKFEHAVSQLDNPLELRGMRKDIARLQTELSTRSKAEKEA